MSTRIPLQNLHNTRDLGGTRAANGLSIKKGKLIRSGNLHNAAEDDLKWLSAHVGRVIDLRTPEECAEQPDLIVPGAEQMHLPVIRSLGAGISRDEESNRKAFSILEAEPEEAQQFMIRAYLEFVTDDYSVAQYGRFAKILSEPDEKAVLWHCTAGKDRAGFASVITEELLGVHRDDIMADYLATNEYLAPETQDMLEMVERQLGGISKKLESTLHYMFTVQEEYLSAVYKKTEELFGSFSGFITKGLCVDNEMLDRFRGMYLE